MFITLYDVNLGLFIGIVILTRHYNIVVDEINDFGNEKKNIYFCIEQELEFSCCCFF